MTPRTANPDRLTIRPVTQAEYPALADLWHDTWHETQAGPVPDELVQLRTRDDFERRLRDLGDLLRVAQQSDRLSGFCAIQDADGADKKVAPGELYQIFVHARARGSGVGCALMNDAESRLRARGHTSAFLKCLPENAASLRFYSRQGWLNTGIKMVSLDTAKGPFHIPCALLTKDLRVA